MRQLPENVLVTGGQGFIGRYVCELLDRLGVKTWAYDKVGGLNILDKRLLTEAVGWSGGVIHLAALLGTAELYSNPHEAVDINVHGTVNVLEALADDDPGKPLVIIEQPHIWYNVYEATHEAATRMARGFHLDFGIPLSVVCAYNAYGPGQAVGPTHPRKIIPTFADSAWRGKPLLVNDSGEQLVDLIYAGDVAHALVTALMGPGDGATYHAGTGMGVSVKRVAEFVRTRVHEHGGPLVPITYTQRRPGENTKGDLRALAPSGTRYSLDWNLVSATVDWYRPASWAIGEATQRPLAGLEP